MIKKSFWAKTDPTGGAQLPQVTAGRLQEQNIVRIHAGSISYSTSRIISRSPFFSFRIIFNESMLKNIQKCITGEHIMLLEAAAVKLDELEKFAGLIVACGVIGGKTLRIKRMWYESWRFPLFNATMPRWRFLEIMKCLRFDLKNERRRNLEEEKFC